MKCKDHEMEVGIIWTFIRFTHKTDFCTFVKTSALWEWKCLSNSQLFYPFLTETQKFCNSEYLSLELPWCNETKLDSKSVQINKLVKNWKRTALKVSPATNCLFSKTAWSFQTSLTFFLLTEMSHFPLIL